MVQNLVLEQMLEDGPVYVDNCRMDEVVSMDLSPEQKANVVVTPQVREEYVAFHGVEGLKALDEYSQINIHKLIHQTSDLVGNYCLANNLFRAVAFDDLKTDFSNPAYIEALKIVEKLDKSVKNSEIMDLLIRSSVAIVGFPYLLYHSPVVRGEHLTDKSLYPPARKQYKSFKQARTELIKNLTLEDVAGRSNKKTRRKVKKRDLREVGESLFNGEAKYTPDRTLNYNDVDIIVQATFDAINNDRDVTVYTADNDLVGKYAEAMGKIVGVRNSGRILKINYFNGQKTKVREIQLPRNHCEISGQVDNILSESFSGLDKSLSENIYRVHRYNSVSPCRTLFRSIRDGLQGVAVSGYTAVMGSFIYHIVQNPQNFYENVKSLHEDGYSMPLVLGSIASLNLIACFPKLGYRAIKDAMGGFKKYKSERRMLK